MARSRFCRCCKEFHDLDQTWPSACADHFGSVSSGGLQIISDTTAPFRSMADGKMYDSKSVYRRDLRARGLIEVGNERVQQRQTPPPPVRETLRQVRQQLMG
jgi:hypothetical protein